MKVVSIEDSIERMLGRLEEFSNLVGTVIKIFNFYKTC